MLFDLATRFSQLDNSWTRKGQIDIMESPAGRKTATATIASPDEHRRLSLLLSPCSTFLFGNWWFH